MPVCRSELLVCRPGQMPQLKETIAGLREPCPFKAYSRLEEGAPNSHTTYNEGKKIPDIKCTSPKVQGLLQFSLQYQYAYSIWQPI